MCEICCVFGRVGYLSLLRVILASFFAWVVISVTFFSDGSWSSASVMVSFSPEHISLMAVNFGVFEMRGSRPPMEPS